MYTACFRRERSEKEYQYVCIYVGITACHVNKYANHSDLFKLENPPKAIEQICKLKELTKLAEELEGSRADIFYILIYIL